MPHRNAPLTETGRLRLARYGCPPLAHLDRASGRPVRRYERAAPGELVHVDIKKLGNIPDGSGWRVAGQARGYQNKKATTTTTARYRHGRPAIGYSYLHTAIDTAARRPVPDYVHGRGRPDHHPACRPPRRLVFTVARRGTYVSPDTSRGRCPAPLGPPGDHTASMRPNNPQVATRHM